jgi:hypothetical protein
MQIRHRLTASHIVFLHTIMASARFDQPAPLDIIRLPARKAKYGEKPGQIVVLTVGGGGIRGIRMLMTGSARRAIIACGPREGYGEK